MQTTQTCAGGAPTPALALAPGSRPLPEYQLIQLLGRGGFGEVWKAAGPGGFEVALKFVHLEGHAGRVEMRALEVMRGIRHGNLLSVFGTWQKDGYLVVAMELADRTLLDRLHEAQAQALSGIPPDELLEYMREAAKGLDFLNEPQHLSPAGTPFAVQHADVKPQNILLVGGIVKLADFGLAQLLDHSMTTRSGGMTPAYVAPEVLERKPTRWSDQYSLAVTYCQLRGGRLPFAGSPMAVMVGHMMNEPDLLMLPPGERAVVARGLTKKAEERWPSCRAFVDALLAAQAGGAVATAADEERRPVGRALTTADQTARRLVLPSRRRLGRRLVAATALMALAVSPLLLWCVIEGTRPGEPGAVQQAEPEAAQAEAAQAEAAQAEVAPREAAQAAPREAAPQPPPDKVQPPSPPPQLKLFPIAPLTLDAGTSRELEVRVQSENGAGQIQLEVEGLPQGVTASPTKLAVNQDTARIEVRAAEDAEEADLAVRVRGTLGAISAEQTVQLTLRVTPALRLLPLTGVTVEAGGNKTVEVRLVRRNCRGPVTLAIDGLPEGVQVQAGDLAEARDTGQLRLSGATAAAAAVRVVRVLAVAQGGVKAETDLRLVVSRAAVERALAEARSRGSRRLSGGEYQKAVEDYTEVIRLDPKDPAAYNDRGFAYHKREEYGKAISDYTEAIRLNPRFALAYHNRANAYLDKKDYARALADYSEAIRLNPRDARAYSSRGHVYSQKGDLDRAIADYDEAIRLNAKYALAYNNRGFANRQKGDLERALADFTVAIRLNPSSAVTYYNRGNAYCDRKEYEQAIADYSEAIRLNPEFSQAYLDRGKAYARKGDSARARADREKALSLDPSLGKK